MSELERFIRGEVDPAGFSHREHLRMAFEMLRVYDFPQSVLYYSRALQQMTARMGRPEIFHQTVTVAFLALVAEALETGMYADFDAFVTAHPQLLDRGVLMRWYAPERLQSAAARRSFLLPQGGGRKEEMEAQGAA